MQAYHTHTHTCIDTRNTYTTHTQMHICYLRVCAQTRTHTHTRIHTRIHTYTHLRADMVDAHTLHTYYRYTCTTHKLDISMYMVHTCTYAKYTYAANKLICTCMHTLCKYHLIPNLIIVTLVHGQVQHVIITIITRQANFTT